MLLTENKQSLNFNTSIIFELEKRYQVNYPILKTATYKSLVNYTTDIKSPIQRWYRYKEGYSLELVNQLFDEYKVKPGDIITDPFCGGGSTILQAKKRGLRGIGFEINPFSVLLARTKTQNYTENDLAEFKKIILKIFSLEKNNINIESPKLSTIDKLFNEDVLQYLLTLKSEIENISNPKVRDLFFLAWLSILEEASNYRKGGNGLKIRKGKNLIKRSLEYAKLLFRHRVREIESDLPFAIKLSQGSEEPIIYEKTALDMNTFIRPETVRGVIFSPPYANCFDYTEIYKVELWMGGFVKEYNDLKGLRKRAVRSHLNGYEEDDSFRTSEVPELEILIEALNGVKLWDKRIPLMIQSYFSDMFNVLDLIYTSLKPEGFCTIIVSNSAYGGVVIPTDLFLARYAERVGLQVTRIDVARFIITSSQQYKQTEQHKHYLRESIIHLRK